LDNRQQGAQLEEMSIWIEDVLSHMISFILKRSSLVNLNLNLPNNNHPMEQKELLLTFRVISYNLHHPQGQRIEGLFPCPYECDQCPLGKAQ
jgi:hypothetical protein